MNQIKCTAWEAIADHYDKIGETHTLKVDGGRVRWELAQSTPNMRTVKVQRFEEGTLRVITAYLRPECDVVLVEVKP